MRFPSVNILLRSSHNTEGEVTLLFTTRIDDPRRKVRNYPYDNNTELSYYSSRSYPQTSRTSPVNEPVTNHIYPILVGVAMKLLLEAIQDATGWMNAGQNLCACSLKTLCLSFICHGQLDKSFSCVPRPVRHTMEDNFRWKLCVE